MVHNNRCDSCRSLLIESEALLPLELLDDDTTSVASSFLDGINRGGLSRPSDFGFEVAVACWQIYEAVKADDNLMRELLLFRDIRRLFVAVSCRMLDSTGRELLIPINYCFKNHDVLILVMERFFNCIAKNLAPKITHDNDKFRGMKFSKVVAKLQGNLKR